VSVAVTQDGGKQVDPVDYNRLADDWRHRIFVHVSRLVEARTSLPALSVDDTTFLHTDFDGKRVLVWQRGSATHVATGAAGHEPIFAWEAKVSTLA
jgi:hypothetical protein